MMISKGMEFDGWGGLVLSLHSPPIPLVCVSVRQRLDNWALRFPGSLAARVLDVIYTLSVRGTQAVWKQRWGFSACAVSCQYSQPWRYLCFRGSINRSLNVQPQAPECWGHSAGQVRAALCGSRAGSGSSFIKAASRSQNRPAWLWRWQLPDSARVTGLLGTISEAVPEILS